MATALVFAAPARAAAPGTDLREPLAQLAAARRGHDVRALVRALVGVSTARQHLGDFAGALPESNEALALAEPLGDSRELASAFNNLGVLCARMGDQKQALAFHQRAYEVRARIHDPLLSDSLANIGIAYRRSGDARTALGYFERALALDRASGDQRKLGFALADMGDVNNQLGNFAQGLGFERASLALREKVGEVYYIIVSHNGVAISLRGLGRLGEARAESERALALARDLKLPRVLKETYEQLALIAEAAQDYRAAYENYRLYQQWADTEIDEAKRLAVAGLEARFETTRKEQQIALLSRDRELQAEALARARLTRDIYLIAGLAALALAALAFRAWQLRRRATEALKVANAALATGRADAEVRAERAQLTMLRYQLNPHFLFNSLNTVRAFVLGEPEKARDLITHLAAFCRLSLARPEAESVPLRDEWAMLEHYLAMEKFRWGDRLQFTAQLDPTAADVNLPVFLLQPLVENAIKYGQRTCPGELALRLGARLKGGRLEIEIANTGRWLAPGAHDTEGTHTGLTNIRERLRHAYRDAASFEIGERDGWVVARLAWPETGLKKSGEASPSGPTATA